MYTIVIFRAEQTFDFAHQSGTAYGKRFAVALRRANPSPPPPPRLRCCVSCVVSRKLVPRGDRPVRNPLRDNRSSCDLYLYIQRCIYKYIFTCLMYIWCVMFYLYREFIYNVHIIKITSTAHVIIYVLRTRYAVRVHPPEDLHIIISFHVSFVLLHFLFVSRTKIWKNTIAHDIVCSANI